MQDPGNDFFDFTFPNAYGHSHQPGHQQQNFSAPPDHSMQPRAFVPPTPNSVEMHGEHARYLNPNDPQSRAIYEQRYQLRKEDAANFTPLGTPAVTPHESSFQVQPEFTVPGAYFSPLTSPALDAQNSRGAHQAYFSQPHTADTSMTTSPIDLDVDMVGEQVQEPLRKLRNKKSGTSTRSSARVRQSPIVKAQNHSHRRKGTMSVIPPKEVSELLEQAQHSGGHSGPASAGLGIPSSRDGSEGESISPEPLSEALMGPPPRPASVTASPSIRAMGSGGQSQPMSEAQQMCPATPASLMRLQPSPQNRSQPSSNSGTPSFIPQSSTQPINDDFALPEPAASTAGASRPGVSRSDTAIHDDQSTPRLSARKTPKLGPLSTPSGSVLPSATISPSISAVASPSSATSTKKFELKPAGRAGKKRGSVGSALVSPALRPKISPSIKPLLPEGATTSDDTHALLLASKSNYQHILEGTHVPGVVYPEALSTNLTSKRTSHKIAEQGRRNRINLALQELQSLIPSPTIKPKDANTSGTPANSSSPEDSQQKKDEKQSSSKASTVENAIEYIRLLKKKDEERDREMMKQRKEIEELRKRLEGGSMDMEKNGDSNKRDAGVSKRDGATDVETNSADDERMDVEAGPEAGSEAAKEKPAEQEAVK
ncbi:hypothetical protein MPH_06097 [Macrophomina phaseolina MS6]|uniref:BHLH domain-containing protein n=1 Tax=Macrophomina phaseolina (strain MS6) TaxID=1126212 RepID=K2RPH2_MACPH|nr:hypothetical protein MPH_06097 [Macrophomina phaseolina MS6]